MWCLRSGMGKKAKNRLNPRTAKCHNETWSKKNCMKACGDCHRMLSSQGSRRKKF